MAKHIDIEGITLDRLAGGELDAKFKESFRKVIQNMQDTDTPYKPVRGITIKLAFAQDESRDNITCMMQISEKLAPQKTTGTSFDVMDTGRAVCVRELLGQLPGQQNLLHLPTVDPDTGEVLEEEVQ